MSRFRTSTHRHQVCHELPLPEVLRKRRESTARFVKQPRRRSYGALFSDLPEPSPAVVAPPSAPVLIPQAPPLSDPHRAAIDLLERRLVKLASALQSQESLLLELRQGPVEYGGLASTFRTVQGLQGGELGFDRKRKLMERIFQSNLVLRERIISPRDLAE